MIDIYKANNYNNQIKNENYYPINNGNIVSKPTNQSKVIKNTPADIESKLLFNQGDEIYIVLNSDYGPEIMEKLKELLTQNKGNKKVFFKVKSSNIETNYKVDYNNVLVGAINDLLKKAN